MMHGQKNIKNPHYMFFVATKMGSD